MSINLKLYVTEDDYRATAGPSWPSYQAFIEGAGSDEPEIQAELDNWRSTWVNDGVKFPIKTATACQSKWTWSTIFLNTLTTASCHRVHPVKFSLDEFDNFHNIPKKLEDRRRMLKGEWPNGQPGWPHGGCEYCKQIEDAGGHSDRMHNNSIYGLTPPELEFDPTAVEVSPRIVEVFAKNTCNMSCLYCTENLSSRIEQENKKFGPFSKDGFSIKANPVYEASTEYFLKFIAWLDKNVHTLKRLHLLGGETFIQHDLMEAVLDILERKGNPDLEFCVFSNGCAPEKYWNLYMNRFKQIQESGNIKVFDLTLSIDNWGEEAEFVRYGLDLELFEQRMAWAAGQGNWLRLNINQTVSAMTMRTMPELIEKINQYSKTKHIGHYFQFTTGPNNFQHPQNFAYEFWSETFDRIYAVLQTTTPEQQEVRVRMEAMQKQLMQVKEHNREQIKFLHIYLDEMDRRRKTNWRKTFSYLDI
jgi:hypothetical protein